MPSAASTRAYRVWIVKTTGTSKRMGGNDGSANWRLRSGRGRTDRTPSEECTYRRPTAGDGDLRARGRPKLPANPCGHLRSLQPVSPPPGLPAAPAAAMASRPTSVAPLAGGSVGKAPGAGLGPSKDGKPRRLSNFEFIMCSPPDHRRGVLARCNPIFVWPLARARIPFPKELRRPTLDGPLCSDQAGMTMGNLVGDTLHHVLRYDASGACVKVPGQDTTRPPLASRPTRWSSATAGCGYGWAIPPAPIPQRLPTSTGSTTQLRRQGGQYLHVAANCHLIVDISWTSPTSPSPMKPPSAMPRWWSVPRSRSSAPEQRARWAIDAPAFLRLDVGCGPTGTGASYGRRAAGINMRNPSRRKPRPPVLGAHDWDIHNHASTDRLVEQIATAFLEDVAVLEAQRQTQVLSTGDLLRERHHRFIRLVQSKLSLALLRRAGFSPGCEANATGSASITRAGP
jgi:hypothetical protein